MPIRRIDLLDLRRQLLLQRKEWRARPDAPNEVEHVLGWITHALAACLIGHGVDGQIEVGRSARHAIAVEAFRRHTDDGDGPGIHPKGAADYRIVTVIDIFPGGVAYDRDQGRAGDIIA